MPRFQYVFNMFAACSHVRNNTVQLGLGQAHPLVVRGELEPGYVLAENSWPVKPLNR
jgi:hypothetical protein